MHKLSKKNSTKLLKSSSKSLIKSHSSQFIKNKSKGKPKIAKTSIMTNDSTSFKMFSTSKLKQELIVKSKSSIKKKKGKKQNQVGIFKNKNKTSSLQNEQKKFQNEKIEKTDFFIYKNVLIPIENTEQRKFVYKIKLAEKSTVLFQNCNKQIMTEQVPEVISEIVPIVLNQSVQIQTDSLTNRSENKYEHLCVQKVQKCFNDTLTELEFLFLPDSRNFDTFTENECKHYNELFINLAEKFDNKIKEKKVLIKEIPEQAIVFGLYQRQCFQMGWIQATIDKGFPTHIYSIISYLSSLFCYVELKEKKNIIAKMNTIYNYSYPQRLSRLMSGKTTQRVSEVLNQKMFSSLEQQLFISHEFSSQLVEKSVHIHNRALFDSVNECLQQFRPFYAIGGEPFPWNNSLGMTFFSIDQNSLHLLFNQVKDRLIDWATFLCGIHLNYDDLASDQIIIPAEKHKLHLHRIKQQQTKMLHQEIKKIDYTGLIEQQYTKLMAQIGNQILNMLIVQTIKNCSEML